MKKYLETFKAWHDVCPHWKSEERIIELIEQNPASEKIKYLLSNPELATQKTRGRQKINCFGTVEFLVTNRENPEFLDPNDVENFVKNNLSPLSRISSKPDKPIVLIARPEPFRSLFYALKNSPRPINGASHACLYLGRDVDGKPLVFEQEGTGFGFRIGEYNTYPSPDFCTDLYKTKANKNL